VAHQSPHQTLRGLLALSFVTASAVALFVNPLHAGTKKDKFNQPGDILISDQYNNRVIEITPSGDIVWSFGNGPADLTSGRSPVGVNDAQRVGQNTLIAGTSNPGGFGECNPGPCVDDRVMLVNRLGKVIWQYGQFGVAGAGPNQLDTPVQATWLPAGHVLITDQANQRVIEVARNKSIVWQYGETGAAGCCSDNVLDSPNSAELLENGHVLIADENNGRAIEVNRDHHIVATFTAGGTLGAVAFASRLENGNTLLTDAGNARAVEVDDHDNVVWQCATNGDSASNPDPQPSRAIRLANGDTIISDQYNNRVFVVDHHMPCNIVSSYGLPLDGGNNTGFGASNANEGLNGPYDAKVLGDFTGLTPPHGFHHD
jgi:outer membrane protein assembly factor BamB